MRDDVLADLSSAVRASAPLFASALLPRQLVSAAWAIVHLGRAWALEPEGMLRRNDLVSAPDLERLDEFLARISYAVMMLLDDCPEEAFANWS